MNDGEGFIYHFHSSKDLPEDIVTGILGILKEQKIVVIEDRSMVEKPN